VYCLNNDLLTSNVLPESQIQVEIVTRAVNTVLLAKRINPKYHPGFSKSFGRCVEAIYGYKRLISMVENLRLEQYDSENESHERRLMALWSNLKPDVMLDSRITKQWQDIGFQGDDPGKSLFFLNYLNIIIINKYLFLKLINLKVRTLGAWAF
jgi:ELMO/CED-12 family